VFDRDQTLYHLYPTRAAAPATKHPRHNGYSEDLELLCGQESSMFVRYSDLLARIKHVHFTGASRQVAPYIWIHVRTSL
jgi:hypothetical protein